MKIETLLRETGEERGFPLGQAFANSPASNGEVKKHQIYGAFLREKCNISSYVCGIESEFSHSALLLANSGNGRAYNTCTIW